MLCFRCEHRAKFLETGQRSRLECGDIETSKAGCYMFTPCYPVITEPLDTDNPRPRFAAPMFSSREWAVRLMNPEEDKIRLYCIHEDGDKVALQWAKSGD